MEDSSRAVKLWRRLRARHGGGEVLLAPSSSDITTPTFAATNIPTTSSSSPFFPSKPASTSPYDHYLALGILLLSAVLRLLAHLFSTSLVAETTASLLLHTTASLVIGTRSIMVVSGATLISLLLSCLTAFFLVFQPQQHYWQQKEQQPSSSQQLVLIFQARPPFHREDIFTVWSHLAGRVNVLVDLARLMWCVHIMYHHHKE